MDARHRRQVRKSGRVYTKFTNGQPEPVVTGVGVAFLSGLGDWRGRGHRDPWGTGNALCLHPAGVCTDVHRCESALKDDAPRYL